MSKFHAVVFAHFETEAEQVAWLMEHGIKQSIPNGGPVFSYSTEDESGCRDKVESLQQRIVKIAYIARKASLCDAEKLDDIRAMTPDPIMSKQQTTEPMDPDLHQFRYAHGGYDVPCDECGERFTGDKRARTCRPCAVKLWKQMSPERNER